MALISHLCCALCMLGFKLNPGTWGTLVTPVTPATPLPDGIWTLDSTLDSTLETWDWTRITIDNEIRTSWLKGCQVPGQHPWSKWWQQTWEQASRGKHRQLDSLDGWNRWYKQLRSSTHHRIDFMYSVFTNRFAAALIKKKKALGIAGGEFHRANPSNGVRAVRAAVPATHASHLRKSPLKPTTNLADDQRSTSAMLQHQAVVRNRPGCIPKKCLRNLAKRITKCTTEFLLCTLCVCFLRFLLIMKECSGASWTQRWAAACCGKPVSSDAWPELVAACRGISWHLVASRGTVLDLRPCRSTSEQVPKRAKDSASYWRIWHSETNLNSQQPGTLVQKLHEEVLYGTYCNDVGLCWRQGCASPRSLTREGIWSARLWWHLKMHLKNASPWWRNENKAE